jgi:hypothetical protein
MQTSRYGNEALVILAPVGVAIVFGVILFGGPTNALDEFYGIARDVTYESVRMVSAWL